MQNQIPTATIEKKSIFHFPRKLSMIPLAWNYNG